MGLVVIHDEGEYLSILKSHNARTTDSDIQLLCSDLVTDFKSPNLFTIVSTLLFSSVPGKVNRLNIVTVMEDIREVFGNA